MSPRMSESAVNCGLRSALFVSRFARDTSPVDVLHAGQAQAKKDSTGNSWPDSGTSGDAASSADGAMDLMPHISRRERRNDFSCEDGYQWKTFGIRRTAGD